MWYLRAENDERVLYITPEKREVIIGRSPDKQICSFPIIDDSSLSRRHASLTLSSNNCLFVQDLDSKYGTFINDCTEKLTTKVQLKSDDIVKLGKLNCIWRVYNLELVTCTSTFEKENLLHLKSILDKIGGQLKNEWDDSCGYLTMPELTLTIEVVFALVQGSYIVTTEFWNKCLESIHNLSIPPDPQLFTPEIIETTLNREETTLNREIVSFLPNDKRKSLFLGIKCVFFSKRQFETYKKVLVKSSAEPLLLSESKLTKASLCEPDFIVIQYNISSTSQETQAQKNQMLEIISYLKSKGKRVIPDTEIRFAILYCSLNKYCNPDFNISNEILKQTDQNKITNILAPESQEITNINKEEQVLLNETLEVTNSFKRKLSEVSSYTQSNKKFASGTNNIENDNCNKRKTEHQEFDDVQNPPKKLAMEMNSSENELFNFVNPTNKNNSKTSEKKLNLSKPMKRKADADTDDDLFNFIKFNDNAKENASKLCRYEDKGDEGNSTVSISNVKKTITTEEIIAMRGKKLEELKNYTKPYSEVQHWIKKEISDDLNQKMNDLDLGTTVVTVKSELIIKKEPVEMQEPVSLVKNFKKFKKVWPVKMMVTVVPKIEKDKQLNDEVNSMVYTQDNN